MPGTITFKPIEANISHDTDLIGKADPYCMFTVGETKIKGQICKSGGTHPVWNDTVSIPATTQSMCLVEVKDKDILKDDKMGYFELDLRQVESQGRLKQWFPLYHHNKPAGQLFMEVIYTPDNTYSQGMGMGMQQGMQHGTQQGMQYGTQQGIQHGQQMGTNYQGVQGTNVTQHTVVTKETHMINPGSYNVQGTQFAGGMYPTNQTSYPVNVDPAYQYAHEAVARGVDPLGTHLNQQYVPQGFTQNYPQQQYGGSTNVTGVNPANLGPQGTNTSGYGTTGQQYNPQFQNQQGNFGQGNIPKYY